MRLLIVGKLEGHTSAAGKIALDKGAKIHHAETCEAALSNLREGNSADLIFLDIYENVKNFINKLKEERIHVPVVTCGINVDSKKAATSITEGAADYLSLPPEPDLIAAVLEAVTKENKAIVFRDPNTQNILDLAKKVAPSTASILITGESGTGKEVIAHYIHQYSHRAGKKFISVNCAAIPENLLESELFGHEKGAFTGAVARRIGKFEEASGGTLLLDEISEMHPRLQAKLLRAIQEQEIDRVGGHAPIKVNIRLIATSNRNLQKEVQEGNFREDLYFRLNVINLQLPPLRARPLDIPALAEHFSEKYCKANNLPTKKVTSKALDALKNHHWPGNVRELENAIHRSILLSAGEQITEDAILLPNTQHSLISSKAATSSSLVGKTVIEVEKDLILETLNHCLGNRTQAANILGISIRTLRNKLKIYTENNEHQSRPIEGNISAYKQQAHQHK